MDSGLAFLGQNREPGPSIGLINNPHRQTDRVKNGRKSVSIWSCVLYKSDAFVSDPLKMSNNGPGTDFGKGDYDLDRVILRLVWKYPVLAIKAPDERTVRWVVK